MHTGKIEFRGALADCAVCPEGRTWAWEIRTEDDSEGFVGNDHVAIDVATSEERPLRWSRFQRYTNRHFAAFVSGGFDDSGLTNIWPDDILRRIAA